MNAHDALALVTSQEPEKHMVLHALQSQAILRAMAARLGKDEPTQELWGLTGLLHDLDYPKTKDQPERHGLVSRELLAGKLPDDALHAIAAHNSEMTGVAPESDLDYALRCAESVTGIIQAAVLMRPTGFDGLEIKSIKKKMKDKAFARSVRRENIHECAQAGLELDEFLKLSIEAMAGVKE